MKVTETKLPGVLIIEPAVHRDSRGMFIETFHVERYAEYGMQLDFVQDNFSRSQKNVLRGMHYRLEHTQGKLVWVTRGQVFDVVIDVRHGSPTFGQSFSQLLDAEHPKQIYIPPGFAHGFCVLVDDTDFNYKCTDYYFSSALEKGIQWNDPDLQIPWPVTDPILSDKDQLCPRLKDINVDDLPQY